MIVHSLHCNINALIVTIVNTTALKQAPGKRTATATERQQQLIHATISSIANNGLSDTTVATVAREAGLSQGIVNLHFQSKDRLLVETLRYVADEYKATWEKALENAGPRHADQLEALVYVDFNRAVFDRDKIAVWFAFWSETKSQPTYRKLCAERDRRYDRKLRELVTTLIGEGGYDHLDADTVTDGLSAMSAGLWLDLLVNPRGMSRQKAKDACRTWLAGLFPRHFAL